MSGFETAAGTFAVVGVADVLIRSSRDIWNFLRDIADAPDELQRLCEFIQETSILYQTSEQCRKNLATQCSSSHNAGAAITSLRSATGALERGLQTLKNLVSRYKGVKNWKNIRIVFGEDRVKKALQTLEHAKALLANALMLTCMYVCVILFLVTSTRDKVSLFSYLTMSKGINHAGLSPDSRWLETFAES
jgi:hypothetical protein